MLKFWLNAVVSHVQSSSDVFCCRIRSITRMKTLYSNFETQLETEFTKPFVQELLKSSVDNEDH
jgi:hypothetical protein